MRSGAVLTLATAATGLMAGAGAAGAQEIVGIATDYQVGLQNSATPVMEDITWLHNDILLPIIVVITLFVLGLLVYVMIRFNAKSNPTPSRTTHNTTIEVLWTVVPVLILVFIAIFSFRMLYTQQTIPESDMTLKVTAHQWYWTYEYPDHEDLTFDSIMLEDDERTADQPRLLAVDNPVVVPAGKTVRVQVTSSDVIHDWAVPSFGIKVDAIPGRLNETWLRVDKPGIYFGQCSELCGLRHAFMPIEVRVLSEQDFASWLEEARAEFAAAPPSEQGRPDDHHSRTAALTPDQAGRPVAIARTED